MKKIYDTIKIQKAINACPYRAVLASLNIPIFLIEYEAGEILVSPWKKTRLFQIVSKGNLQIYFIRNDGSSYSISSGSESYIIGEMDLFMRGNDGLFAEATTKLVTIAFDSDQYHDTLLNNNIFLRFIASTLARKLETVSGIAAVSSTLSERLIRYIQFNCENLTLKGIEKAAFKLHCSPRQLQRILNKYESEGKVKKTGKGSYQLLL